MHVAILRLELRFVPDLTLRQKRRVLHAMARKLRKHFNITIDEVDDVDRPSLATLGVAAVGRYRRATREVLERVADVVTSHPRVEVLAVHLVDR